MNDINRISGTAVGRCRAVAHGGLVYAVATDPDESPGVAEQTRRTLAAIERNLLDAGSDKTRLLSATVYLTDISTKAEMDAEWNAWIGPDHWPQRACVQAGLAGDTRVEITVVAALRQ